LRESLTRARVAFPDAISACYLPSVHPLHNRVLAYIDDPAGDSFETLALETFAHQFEAVAPYREYCQSRGRTPKEVRQWSDIPAVPIQAFKRVDLCCGPAVRTFLSTGTSEGPQSRSRHLMPDLRLYERSAVAGMRAYLFPDIAAIRLVSLVARSDLEPYSSLAQMAGWAFERFAGPGSVFAMTEKGLEVETLIDALHASENDGEPCCIMTTTGALVRVLDHARERGLTFRLPHGSRLMDTGGDKGAPRRLSRGGLLHACWSTFGIPGYFCVNEYGMAELSSQFYDNVIAHRCAGRFTCRYKVGPPWTRTLVLDPSSLAPVPHGRQGLLCHFDLANAGTAMAVLTEDVGRAVDDGFELLGRASGAESRGCSLAITEWEASMHTGEV
jgi:hypothetical protein